ncbi:MAG: TonB-dependent receptor [Acidobacteriota bacterium]|nr:TonB-dependent receptor [Acidobacteriota bacterium]
MPPRHSLPKEAPTSSRSRSHSRSFKLVTDFLGRVALLSAAVWLLGGSLAAAQSPQGSLVGTVYDPSGAVIAGATVTASSTGTAFSRTARSGKAGEFTLATLPPGTYELVVTAPGFAPDTRTLTVGVGTTPSVVVTLQPAGVQQGVTVRAARPSLASQPLDATSNVQQTVISAQDLKTLPLAHRSFANIAYLAPMTEPVEPSDPTKARITAVSFAGSSGLNVDLSVDGGNDSDDYIGGFLQNISPDAIQDFVVRTSQFNADTSHTNGGSVIISTRSGTDQFHWSGAGYFTGPGLVARNTLDNPAPSPKPPYSRQDGSFTLGGPIARQKAWFFASAEGVAENANISYNNDSLAQFRALAQLAANGDIPGVSSIDVPTSVSQPFRDFLFTGRVDWAQSDRSQWFVRTSIDRYHTTNDLVQQGTLPSTGALTRSRYFTVLASQNYQFSPNWLGTLMMEASLFDHTEDRNSNIGLALAFPFSSTALTTSGFETFGDNQFVTPITAFPVARRQEKYQFRYDLVHPAGNHTFKTGVNFIHEPVLSGQLASSRETLVTFPENPAYYLANPAVFASDFAANSTFVPASDGSFSQNVQRLGLYAQDSWRVIPSLTLNYGVRYDTTFGLFIASGRDQSQNPAYITLQALGIPLVNGIPHDYRKAIAPRFGFAWAPGNSDRTVVRGGAGLYYNDLAQNGWVTAFQAVDQPFSGLLGPGDQGTLIDPGYKTPYALQASLGFEHAFRDGWRLNVQYQHTTGVHQYRLYQYVSGYTLPADAPSINLARSDNRSRYDGLSVIVSHELTKHFEVTANYTLAKAQTWGATVGELFDYVNLVTNVNDAFGPGDYGPSGEDVRHRVVLAGTLLLPGDLQVATLSQFETARPYTLTTPVDVNNDGVVGNDRAVVNGVPTTLDEFRGTPYMQVDLRVSRTFRLADNITLMPFLEMFNLFDRMNPGNNYVPDVSVLPVPPGQLANVQDLCTNAACTATVPVTSLNQLRVPAGALGDFFGPGTTVGIPFMAQFGFRMSF